MITGGFGAVYAGTSVQFCMITAVCEAAYLGQAAQLRMIIPTRP